MLAYWKTKVCQKAYERMLNEKTQSRKAVIIFLKPMCPVSKNDRRKYNKRPILNIPIFPYLV